MFATPCGTNFSRKLWFLSSTLLASAFVLALLSCQAGPDKYTPRVTNGVIDLRGYNFESLGPIELGGTWDFLSGTLCTGTEFEKAGKQAISRRNVPDFWMGTDAGAPDGTGSGTYRVKILLDAQREDLAIRWSTVSTAFSLEADGKTIACAGVPALEKKDYAPAYMPGTARLGQTGTTVELVVRVSNYVYRNGGLWRIPVFGTQQQIENDKRVADALSVALTAAIVTTALGSGFSFLFRRRDKSHLFFALFAFAVALRPLVTGEYLLVWIFPGISFDILIRLEYLTVIMPIAMGCLYFLSFFDLVSQRRLWMVFTLPLAPFLAIVGVAPLPIMTRSIFWLYALGVVLIVFLVIKLFAHARRHHLEGAWAMIAAGGILIGAACNDVLYASFVLHTGNLLPWALAITIFLQAGVLACRSARSQSRLEELINEKEMLLMEVHHRVRNSLQIVSSIISLQSRRSSNQAIKAAYESIRDRIRVISVAHERLYKVGGADHIDARGYLEELLDLLDKGFQEDTRRKIVNAQLDSFEVSVGFAIDMGLIVTELVGNAYKYAVMHQGSDVNVVLTRTEKGVELVVSDRGPGFPQGFDPMDQKSFGFRIIQSMLKKYSGSLHIHHANGAHVHVFLPFNEKTAT